MIIVTVDGLNWEYAKKYYSDIFPEQSMGMMRCDVRMFDHIPTAGPTANGLACMWSGERIKSFHPTFLEAKHSENNIPYVWELKNGKKMDLLWNYFKNPKFYFRHQGPSWQDDYKELFKHFHSLENVKRCPSEELCVFSEAMKKDYDLFWIHSAIVKGGVFMPGCYEQGRIPALMTYDEVRKNKPLKKETYVFGIRRYVEVIKYLQEMLPDELFVISADHGTFVDPPWTPEQIDNIPVIVNKKDVDMSKLRFQWDFKKFILGLKNG